MLRGAIFVTGLVSLITGTLTGRAQANIKGQIGYAAIAQVGVMFMEVSLGLETLVLWHMVSHAILRTYQFLTSPSVVAHFIRFPVPEQKATAFGWWNHPWIRRLSIGEFFLEEKFSEWLVRPLRNAGQSMLLVWGLALMGGFRFPEHRPVVVALAASWSGFSARSSQRTFWWTIVSLLCVVIGGSGGTEFSHPVLWLCLSGILPGIFLWHRSHPTLRFYGWLCLAGFPITGFFLGEDLLLHEASRTGWVGMILFFLVFALNGIHFARAFVEQTWLPRTRGL